MKCVKIEGTREMVQRLRVVAGFAKDQDLVPSKHGISQPFLTPVPG